MIKKWKHSVDQGDICGTLFTVVFYSYHNFWLFSTWSLSLPATFQAFGFPYESVKLINSFLSDRKHRAKLNSSYSSFLGLLIEVT